MKTSDLFYIHNGYVGDALLLWRPNRCGYTVNIDEAGLYTKDEIATLHRPEDRVISFADAQTGIVRAVCSEKIAKVKAERHNDDAKDGGR